MDQNRQEWIRVAAALGRDPTLRLPCPSCGKGVLEVEDIMYEVDPTLMSRTLRCPSCGQTETLDRLPRVETLNRPGIAGGSQT